MVNYILPACICWSTA